MLMSINNKMIRLISIHFSGAIPQDFHKRFLFGKYAATLFQCNNFAFHDEKWTMCARSCEIRTSFEGSSLNIRRD